MLMNRTLARSDRPVTVYAIVPSRPDCANSISAGSSGRLGTVSAGPYTAVISAAPLAAGWDDSDQTRARRLAAYQGTLSRIMLAAPLLPVKFGTCLPDVTSVRESLSRGSRAFDDAFGRLKDCVQFEVIVRWNLEAIYNEIADEPTIARLKERSAMAVRDDVWRAALGRLVQESLERRRAVLAGQVGTALRSAAMDAIVRPVETDTVVLHMALLVRAEEISVLDECLAALKQAYDRLEFVSAGPQAPYSFATVEINLVEPVALERARHLFGVSAEASADDIRTAYRELVRTVHAGDDADGHLLATLTNACRLLLHQAAESSRGGAGEGGGCDVVVSVSRQDREAGWHSC